MKLAIICGFFAAISLAPNHSQAAVFGRGQQDQDSKRGLRKVPGGLANIVRRAIPLPSSRRLARDRRYQQQQATAKIVQTRPPVRETMAKPFRPNSKQTQIVQIGSDRIKYPPRDLTPVSRKSVYLPARRVASFPGTVRRTVRTTAYTHTEADHLAYGNLTAIGTRLRATREHTSAAADWSRFPLGTTFRIVGENTTYVVEDYGSALVGTDTIDIYRPTRSSMNHWGVRNVEIIILKMGCFDQSRTLLAKSSASHCREMYHSLSGFQLAQAMTPFSFGRR